MRLTLFFVLSFFSILFSQEAKQAAIIDDLSSISKYKSKIFQAEIKNLIKSDDEKNFKKLREFLSLKEGLLNKLNIMRREYEGYSDTNSTYYRDMDRNLSSLENIVKQSGNDKTIRINPELIPNYGYAYYQAVDSFPRSKIDEFLKYYQGQLKLYSSNFIVYDRLSKNIENIEQDIQECSSMIDEALAPERADQDFKMWMSGIFAALVGITLGFFFYGVYKRSDQDLSKELLSGNGLQFVTLFVLIIAIILFGILGILQGSELAAILSGISGYILGKGTQSQKIDKILEVTNDLKKQEPGT